MAELALDCRTVITRWLNESMVLTSPADLADAEHLISALAEAGHTVVITKTLVRVRETALNCCMAGGHRAKA